MADNPITRKEKYLAKLTGSYTGNVPAPITRVEKYLYDLCQKGISGLTPEEIENAVNKYLKENPVQPGATEEQAQQIKQNTDDVALLKEDLSTKITKFYASSQGETHLADSDNGKITDMVLYGRSEQKQYSGKNLLNPTLQTTIKNGVTCTANGDGTYTLNGTTTTTTAFDIAQDVSYSSFRLAGCPVGGAHDVSYELQARTDNLIYGYDTGDGKNIKANENFFIRIRINTGINCNNLLFKPMIVDASLYPDATYDDFEPYVGGQPSPSPDYPQEIKSVVNPTVKVCGKNLLNATLQTTTQNGVTCTNNGDGTYTLNGKLSSNTIFTLFSGSLSIDNKSKIILMKNDTFADSGIVDSYCAFKISSSWDDAINYPTIKEIPSGKIVQTINLVLRLSNSGAPVTLTNVLIKPMIVDASLYSDTTYDDFEPYHKQTVTLPYTLNAIPVSSGGNATIDGQQYVSDYVDVERGKLVKMVDSSKLDNTQSIVGKTEWLLAEPQETDLTKEEIAAFKALATYYPTTNISVNSEQLDGYTVFNYPISMANIITSLKTKTENLESANYTDRGTLADTDAFLVNDGTGMKKSVLSKLSDFVLNKIADKVFAKLQTNDKTILGAINELNSNTRFDVTAPNNVSIINNASIKVGRVVYIAVKLKIVGALSSETILSFLSNATNSSTTFSIGKGTEWDISSVVYGYIGGSSIVINGKNAVSTGDYLHVSTVLIL